jgi:soluble lytic murein transglycosylase-like protein
VLGWDRLGIQERSMHTTTQKLMLQGGLILLGALMVSSIGGWARRATADDQPTPLTAPALIGELRALEQALEATRGELAVARLQLERANAIIDYSTHYTIAADLAAAIYDVALAEGVDPALAFRLVKVESGFNSKAKSKVGAIGLTQVLPSTARLYEPGLTTAQLYDRGTNLRLGFRYLRDLLERYEGNPDAKLRLALLAYNRGPGRVQELLDAGKDPQNGYATALMKGYRRKS